MMRSIGAVLIGFALIAILSVGGVAGVGALLPGRFSPQSHLDDPMALALIIGYLFVFAAAGCYLAARLAPCRPMRHALATGALALAACAATLTWQANRGPVWYHAVSLLLVMPAAWLGGWLWLERFGAGPRNQRG